MKHSKTSRARNQGEVTSPFSLTPGSPVSDNRDPRPAVDDIAVRAYFNYRNQGSQDGQDLQHWLAAESELSAEHRMP